MEPHSSSGRRPNHPLPATSPRIVRSRSTTEFSSAVVAPTSSTSVSRSQRVSTTVSRSKSTTRSRDPKTEPERKPGDGLVRFLPHRESPHTGSTRPRPRPNPNPNLKPRSNYIKQSPPSSPSAWALSPGRPNTNYFPNTTLPPPSPSQPATAPKSRRGGGMSGVWKYFRPRNKGSSKEEEERRKEFITMNGRLAQWRFANAKAEAAAEAANGAARARLVGAWVKVREKRRRVMERRMEIQRLKHVARVSRVMSWQLSLLDEWGRMEGKNAEAVSRVTRKLAALSVKIPLMDDVKGEVESVGEALTAAGEVMEGIEEMLTKFFSQLERNLYMVTELTSSVENQNERLAEMEKIVVVLAHLLALENNVRVELIQMVD